ncbi:MAG: hypothetical protein M1840_003252 [Geoglossum simile]|nr:MAG: hypothetical protein M1840_003252 [Geoglossum simile]
MHPFQMAMATGNSTPSECEQQKTGDIDKQEEGEIAVLDALLDRGTGCPDDIASSADGPSGGGHVGSVITNMSPDVTGVANRVVISADGVGSTAPNTDKGGYVINSLQRGGKASIDDSQAVPGNRSGEAACGKNNTKTTSDIDYAIEYFRILRNCCVGYRIVPIRPYGKAWVDHQSLNSVGYCGENCQVGDAIRILTPSEKGDSIAKIKAIKSLGHGRYVFHIFWYYKKEEIERRLGVIEDWPIGNTHMRSTHMDVVLWDTTNGRASAEQLDKLCRGKIFDLTSNSVRNEADDQVAWAN